MFAVCGARDRSPTIVLGPLSRAWERHPLLGVARVDLRSVPDSFSRVLAVEQRTGSEDDVNDRPKIKAIAPWFGGKRTLAQEIATELGPHRVLWDMCCGSLAVTMACEPCVMETAVDLHGDLTNLACVIQHPTEGPRLYRRLRRTMMSEVLFNEAADRIRSVGPPDEIDADRAADYMLTTWLGRNGVAGTSSYNHGFCVRYTANGGHAAKRWDSVTRSLLAWRRRLRNVTILRRDIFEVLPRIEDRKGTAIYVDPPYLKKGASYLHDFDEQQHVRLAEMLQRFHESRVVVSYYDDPLLGELYPGWHRREFDVSKAMASSGKRGKRGVRACEVLLLNGPSNAQVSAQPRRLFT